MIKTIAICAFATCVNAQQELKDKTIVIHNTPSIVQTYAEEQSKRIMYASKNNDRESYEPEAQKRKREAKQKKEVKK